MNPFLLILLQAGINIANGHVKNKAGGEVLDLTSFILDAAQAIDSLHQEEVGEPLDWSKIRHHQPLAPAGQAPEFLGDPATSSETPEPSEPEDPPPDPPANDA